MSFRSLRFSLLRFSFRFGGSGCLFLLFLGLAFIFRLGCLCHFLDLGLSILLSFGLRASAVANPLSFSSMVSINTRVYFCLCPCFLRVPFFRAHFVNNNLAPFNMRQERDRLPSPPQIGSPRRDLLPSTIMSTLSNWKASPSETVAKSDRQSGRF